MDFPSEWLYIVSRIDNLHVSFELIDNLHVSFELTQSVILPDIFTVRVLAALHCGIVFYRVQIISCIRAKIARPPLRPPQVCDENHKFKIELTITFDGKVSDQLLEKSPTKTTVFFIYS